MVDLSGGQEASAGSGEEGEQSYELKSEKGKIGLIEIGGRKLILNGKC